MVDPIPYRAIAGSYDTWIKIKDLTRRYAAAIPERGWELILIGRGFSIVREI